MKAFIFDTETSGLVENRIIADKHLPEIIEFYGCSVDLLTEQILKEVNTLIKPRRTIEPIITEITGITNDMLSEAPPFSRVAEEIISAIEAAPLVIAHNLSYDKEMVDIETDRIKLQVKWPPLLCTVEQTIHLKGFRLSLTALHEHLFNEPFADAHRAKIDVQALVRCCCELYRRELI